MVYEDVGLRARIDNVSGFERDAKKVQNAANGIGDSMTAVASKSTGMGSKLSAVLGGLGKFTIGLAAVTAGVYGLSKAWGALQSLIAPAAQWEQYEVIFATLMKSADAGKQKLEELSDFARKTPFTLPSVVEASKQLLAYGFTAEELIPMLRRVGDAAAGLGEDSFPRIIRALGQMRARTKVSAQEMLQLTEAGVPAWQMLADAMGLSVGEIQKLSEQGLIPADRAISVLLEGMEKRFGGLMETQSKTFTGILSNLKDWAFRAQTIIGGPVLEKVKGFMTGLLATLDTPEMTARLEQLGQTFATVMGGISRTIAPLANVFKAVFGGLGTVAGPAMTALKAIAGTIEGVFRGLVDLVKPQMDAIRQSIGSAWAEIAPLVRPALENVQKFIRAFLDTVQSWWNEHGATILAIVKNAFGGITDVIKYVIDQAKNIIKVGLAIIGGDWSTAWESLKQIPQTAFRFILGIMERFQQHAYLLLKLAVETFRLEDAWYGIRDFVLKIWTDVVNGIKTQLNKASDALQKVINGLNAVARKLHLPEIKWEVPKLNIEEFVAPPRPGWFSDTAGGDLEKFNSTVADTQKKWLDFSMTVQTSGDGTKQTIAEIGQGMGNMGPQAQSGANAAKAAIAALEEEVKELEVALRSAEDAMRAFSDPRLVGMQAAEDEMFELDMAIKRARLAELGLGEEATSAAQEVKDAAESMGDGFDMLAAQQRELATGIPVPFQKAMYEMEQAEKQSQSYSGIVATGAEAQSESERLSRLREAKQLMYDLTYEPQLRRLRETFEDMTGANEEVTFGQAQTGLENAYRESLRLSLELTTQRSALQAQQQALADIEAATSNIALGAGDIADSEQTIVNLSSEQAGWGREVADLYLEQLATLREQEAVLQRQSGLLLTDTYMDELAALEEQTAEMQRQHDLVEAMKTEFQQIADTALPTGATAGYGHEIPGLQEGGTITKAGMAIVGERGPEPVMLPVGATVLPRMPQTASVSKSYSDVWNITQARDTVDVMNEVRKYNAFKRILGGR